MGRKPNRSYQVKALFRGQKRWSPTKSLWFARMTKKGANKLVSELRKDVGLIIPSSVKIIKKR